MMINICIQWHWEHLVIGYPDIDRFLKLLEAAPRVVTLIILKNPDNLSLNSPDSPVYMYDDIIPLIVLYIYLN